MQPFTKADWDYVAGAEAFATGEQPEICHGNDWLFAMDANRIELHTPDGAPAVKLLHGLPYKAAARLADTIVNGLDYRNEAAGLMDQWGFTDV
jgi:hypothetical protein